MRKILFLLVFLIASSVWAQIPTAVIEKAREMLLCWWLLLRLEEVWDLVYVIR